MRLAVIAIVLLLLFGAAGGGGYYYFYVLEEKPLTEEEQAERERAEKAARREKRKIIDLPRMTVPILGAEGVSQTFTLVVALEVVDENAAKKVEKVLPIINSLFIKEIYSELNHHAAISGGAIQLSNIKDRLKKAANDLFKEDYIYDVLMKVASQSDV